MKYVKSQRSYGFLITKELFSGFQILDLKDHFSAFLNISNLNYFFIFELHKTNITPFLSGFRKDFKDFEVSEEGDAHTQDEIEIAEEEDEIWKHEDDIQPDKDGYGGIIYSPSSMLYLVD